MNVQKSRMTLVATVLVLALLVAGCGNAGILNGGSETALRVVDANGQETVIDLKDGPVLFIAYWCPHCENFLTTAPLQKLPTIVSTFPRQGDTVDMLIRETRAKLERTGWKDTPFYVMMEYPAYATQTPLLVWWDGYQIQTINPFELTLDDLRNILGDDFILVDVAPQEDEQQNEASNNNSEDHQH